MSTSLRKTWVIPMAGGGSRTLSLGSFKPFIEVNGRPIVEWLLVSVHHHFEEGDRVVFITTRAFEDEFGVAARLEAIRSTLCPAIEFHLVLADDTPQGPAKSVYLASEYFDTQPVIIVNSDQFIDFPAIEFVEGARTCALVVNLDFGTSKSYVKLQDNKVVDVVEKDNVSNIASCGVYAVSNGTDLKHVLERSFDAGQTVNGEYYVAPALRYLLEMDYEFVLSPAKARYDLGNVADIEHFERISRLLAP